MASSPRIGSESAAPRVIAMLNQKGGVGKTTSAVNLGAAIAQEGWRVCLIDLDPQGHLTLHLGIDPSQVARTVYDLLIDPDCSVDEALIPEARPNLDVILAEVDLAGAESELATNPDRVTILRRKLVGVVDRYDVIIIDCPPSLGLLTMNALTLATEIFVPMQAHFLALQGVGRLLETVGLVGRSVNPGLRVSGILLCMHEGQTTLAKEVVADLDAFFEQARDQDVPWRDCRVLRPPIRRNIKLAEAPSFGNTIFDYAPWCPGALDYRKLASRLLADWDAQTTVADDHAPVPVAHDGVREDLAEEPEQLNETEQVAGDQSSAIPDDSERAAEREHEPEIVIVREHCPDLSAVEAPESVASEGAGIGRSETA